MGFMKKKLTQKEVDEMVISQADDDNAWGKWIAANPARPVSIRLSQKTVASLKVLAKLKKEKGYQTLLKKWIDERLIYEQRILKEIRSLF
jgi:hypothetical protein